MGNVITNVILCLYLGAIVGFCGYMCIKDLRQHKRWQHGLNLMMKVHQLVMTDKIPFDEAHQLRKHLITPTPTEIKYVELWLKEHVNDDRHETSQRDNA
jgi:hypothetical protein